MDISSSCESSSASSIHQSQSFRPLRCQGSSCSVVGTQHRLPCRKAQVLDHQLPAGFSGSTLCDEQPVACFGVGLEADQAASLLACGSHQIGNGIVLVSEVTQKRVGVLLPITIDFVGVTHRLGTPERNHVRVLDPPSKRCLPKRILGEALLTRERHLADIDNSLHTRRLQLCKKNFEASSLVPNGHQLHKANCTSFHKWQQSDFLYSCPWTDRSNTENSRTDNQDGDFKYEAQRCKEQRHA